MYSAVFRVTLLIENVILWILSQMEKTQIGIFDISPNWDFRFSGFVSYCVLVVQTPIWCWHRRLHITPPRRESISRQHPCHFWTFRDAQDTRDPPRTAQRGRARPRHCPGPDIANAYFFNMILGTRLAYAAPTSVCHSSLLLREASTLSTLLIPGVFCGL